MFRIYKFTETSFFHFLLLSSGLVCAEQNGSAFTDVSAIFKYYYHEDWKLAWSGLIKYYIETVTVNKSSWGKIQYFSGGFFANFVFQMLVWIRENHQEFLLNYAEIGNDTTSADELQEEHRNFQGSCMVSQVLGSKLRNSDIISKQFSCIYVQNKSVRIFESCISRACLFVVVISVQTI